MYIGYSSVYLRYMRLGSLPNINIVQTTFVLKHSIIKDTIEKLFYRLFVEFTILNQYIYHFPYAHSDTCIGLQTH